MGTTEVQNAAVFAAGVLPCQVKAVLLPETFMQ